jgi:hypothetical protein
MSNRWLLFRFWLELNPAVLGLAIAAVAGGALFLLVITPVGPPKPMLGVVERIGTVETDEGSYPVAVVRVGERHITVRLSRLHACTVGGQIRLTEQRRPWGLTYIPGWRPCTP